MHIPDGFLGLPALVPAWFFSLSGLGFAWRKLKGTVQDRTVPLLGIMAAFIFAGQMLNFPVAGGTSGHLLGGVLTAVMLGPFSGAFVLTAVLFVQALVFQDGGLLALGANIFNMAIVGTMGGYLCFFSLKKLSRNFLFSAGVSAWFSVVAASTFCALELALSGTIPLRIVLPGMVGIHTLIGLGEASITCFVLSFLQKVRPDLIYSLSEGGISK